MESPGQPCRMPKKTLKRVLRPKAPIPNCPDYNSVNSDTSTLVGEDTDDGVVTVLLKKRSKTIPYYTRGRTYSNVESVRRVNTNFSLKRIRFE